MTFTAEVLDVHPITPRVSQFRLRVPGHEFDHDPGQHTTVRFESAGEEVVRPYTPTNLPGTDELTLAIKRYDDGFASSYVHERTRRDEVTLGPLEGNLALDDPGRDVAFVATGTGVTPMMAMLRQYLDEGRGDAHLLFGETDERSIIYRETLAGLAATHGNLTVTYSLSDPSWRWTDRIGYVQTHLDDLFDESDFAERDFYVCGVPEMVVDTRERLAELGTPDARIHTEGWEEGAVTEESDGSGG